MFLDHFASAFFPQNEMISLIFRFLGRMAAPIFCYFIAEGYYHTSNLKKYIIRLLVFAVISHFPYYLAFGLKFYESSVILPLALGLIALTAVKSDKVHIILKFVILAVCCAVSYTSNWNFIAVLWIVAFGLLHGKFDRQMIAFFVICVFYLLIQPFRRFGIFNELQPQWFQLGVFLAIPLLAMYSGSQGKKSPAMKWLFYIFYPAHLILIFILRHFTSLDEVLNRILIK